MVGQLAPVPRPIPEQDKAVLWKWHGTGVYHVRASSNDVLNAQTFNALLLSRKAVCQPAFKGFTMSILCKALSQVGGRRDMRFNSGKFRSLQTRPCCAFVVKQTPLSLSCPTDDLDGLCSCPADVPLVPLSRSGGDGWAKRAI